MNEKLINVNFLFTSGEKYKIQCSPNIKVKELITYFLESLNSNNYEINKLKEELFFLFEGQLIDKNSSMLLNKIGIIEESIILVEKNNIDEII